MIDREELRRVLNAHFAASKARNGSYSLRAYARKLGVGPASLSEIMRGKRRVSDKRAQHLVQCLSLLPAEEKRVLGGAIGLLANDVPKPFEALPEERYRTISDWYHFAILSLAETADFRCDDVWIATRLSLPVDTVAAAIERLAKLDLITLKPDGSWTVTGKSFCTSDEVASAALRAAHADNLDLAKESLASDPVECRDFRAITMAIDPAKLPEAKRLICEFRDRLCAFLENGEKSEVYKMCIQLFPLSS